MQGFLPVNGDMDVFVLDKSDRGKQDAHAKRT
jgi:hypothetical protein